MKSVNKILKMFFIWVAFFCTNTRAQTIVTFAGGGTGDVDNISATISNIGLPFSGCFDGKGNFYFGTNRIGPRVRMVDTNGIIHTVAGSTSGFSGDGGPATDAKLKTANCIVDMAGNIFIADWYNNRLRKVNASTGIIETIAGNGVGGHTGDGGLATDAKLVPLSVCLDKNGNLFILDSDSASALIRKIDTFGVITTFAGNGMAGFSGDGGQATDAAISVNFGICTDGVGNLYLGCPGRIRKIDAITRTINTIAGSGRVVYNGDGISVDSAGFQPYVIAIDVIGNIYVGDWNQRIRKIDTFGIIHTVAGNGIGGYSGDGGPADSAEILYPEGIAFDACGNMYIADDNNGRIRKVSPLSPIGITVAGVTIGATGDSVTVSATVHNAGYHYTITWLNNGVPFATTTTPSVSYIKTHATDSITAVVYGCSDSAVSAVHVVTDSRVGVAQVAAGGSVSLYPNPGNSEFSILSPERVVSVVVTNLTGEAVYTGASALVNVKPWPPGMYFVKVNGVSVLKFLKE